MGSFSGLLKQFFIKFHNGIESFSIFVKLGNYNLFFRKSIEDYIFVEFINVATNNNNIVRKFQEKIDERKIINKIYLKFF